jgi:hypothetical protein
MEKKYLGFVGLVNIFAATLTTLFGKFFIPDELL